MLFQGARHALGLMLSCHEQVSLIFIKQPQHATRFYRPDCLREIETSLRRPAPEYIPISSTMQDSSLQKLPYTVHIEALKP